MDAMPVDEYALSLAEWARVLPLIVGKARRARSNVYLGSFREL